jgi:hypothetical protein
LRTECSLYQYCLGLREGALKGGGENYAIKKFITALFIKFLSTNQMKKKGVSEVCVTQWATQFN